MWLKSNKHNKSWIEYWTPSLLRKKVTIQILACPGFDGLQDKQILWQTWILFLVNLHFSNMWATLNALWDRISLDDFLKKVSHILLLLHITCSADIQVMLKRKIWLLLVNNLMGQPSTHYLFQFTILFHGISIERSWKDFATLCQPPPPTQKNRAHFGKVSGVNALNNNT